MTTIENSIYFDEHDKCMEGDPFKGLWGHYIHDPKCLARMVVK